MAFAPTTICFRILAALFLFARAVHATDFDPIEIGKWPPYRRGAIQNFAVSDNFIYGVMANEGLIILDHSNPAKPQRVGGCDTAGFAKDVAVKGNILFIADGWQDWTQENPNAGLVIIDATDKANPRIVRNLSHLDARALFLAGDHLYVVAAGKLHVFDITQPLDPRPLGECEITNTVSPWKYPKFAWRDNLLFIANNDAGLEIVNVANPAAPRRLATFDTPSDARAVAFFGNYAYVADNQDGIKIVEVSNPETPQPAGQITIAGWTVSLATHNGCLIAGNSAGLCIFDLTNPLSPTLRAQTASALPNDLLAIGSTLFSAEDSSGFSLYELAAAPQLTQIGEFVMSAYSYDVKIVGDHAFVASTAGLEIIDLRDPRRMASIARWQIPTYVISVDVRGEFAYLGGGSGAVCILNISRLERPSLISETSVGGNIWNVRLAGSFLLVEASVSQANTFLAAFDVANPAAPRRLEWPALAGFDRIVEVAGRYAYLSSSQANKLAVLDLEATPPAIVGIYEDQSRPNSPWRGLRFQNFLYVNERAFDVSDPAAPRLAGTFPSAPWEIATDGTYLYGAAGQFVHKYDLTDPASPRLIGVSSSINDLYSSVSLKGGTVFFVSSQGLHAFDMTKPANPQRSATTTQRSLESDVRENLAFVAQNGLAIFDISDRSHPVEVSRTGASLSSLALYGSYAYASGYVEGIKVIDASVPSIPRIVKTVRPGNSFYEMAVSGSRLYAGGDTFRIFDLSQPSDPIEVGAFPTQSISQMTISDGKAYIVSEAGRFEILDVSDPGSIRSLFQFSGGNGSYARSAAVSGNYLFLSHFEYPNSVWLATFDITDHNHPLPIARIPIRNSRMMSIAGNHLYNQADGLEVFDISDPANIKLVGRNGNVIADHIRCAGDWIYVSSYDGWHILHSFTPSQNDPLRFDRPSVFPSWKTRLVGLPGIDVQVDQSADLLNWQNLTTFTLPRDGKVVTASEPSANLFLRAKIR